MKVGRLDAYWLRTLRQPTTALNDEISLSVGSAETISGGPPSLDQGTTDAVSASLSGDGNDPERRASEADQLVTNMDAANSHDPAQTPRQPFPVLPHEQVNSSVGHAETDPGNTPLPLVAASLLSMELVPIVMLALARILPFLFSRGSGIKLPKSSSLLTQKTKSPKMKLLTRPHAITI